MPDIALINLPSNPRFPQPNMGLAVISAVLREHGHNASIIDANADNLSADDTARLASGARMVGLTATTPLITSAMDMAHAVKKLNPDSIVVLGGAHATLLPHETLQKCSSVDMIARGEGEQTIIELADALQNGKAVKNIAGITYRNHEGIACSPDRDLLQDVDSLPFPDYEPRHVKRYRPYPPHGRRLPYLPMITSRGCPYHCAYCSKPIFGSKYRAQSVPRVLEELVHLKHRYGVREIAFYDDVFTMDRRRIHHLCEEMLRAGLEVSWTCETRVNLVDYELLRVMKKAGCYAVSYGIESGVPEIRDSILHKGISNEQIEETIRLTRRAGIETIGYMMIGSPGETPETIRATVEYASRIGLDYAQFAVTVPFPGTELYVRYLEQNPPPVDWSAFSYYRDDGAGVPVFETPDLPGDMLSAWAKKAQRRFYFRPSYVLQRLARIRSASDVSVAVQGLIMLLRGTR